jgi:hypothetical protein
MIAALINPLKEKQAGTQSGGIGISIILRGLGFGVWCDV